MQLKPIPVGFAIQPRIEGGGTEVAVQTGEGLADLGQGAVDEHTQFDQDHGRFVHL
jgi:hypothetical protein